MKVPKLIGITGKAGAGKDTLADHLAVVYGATKHHFALPLKQGLNSMFGWTMEMWADREWKEAVIPWLGKSPRQLAQTIGTEWGRELIHPELWVLLAEQRYLSYEGKIFSSCCPFVIADVRFNNEAAMIRRQGGVVLQVIREEASAINQHKSEAGLQPGLVDIIVPNNGTVDEFLAESLMLLERYHEHYS